MKRIALLLFVVISPILSCIKPALPNPEADIEKFDIDPGLTTGNTFIDQANRKIRVFLTAEAFDNGFAPSIGVSSGATITPASGDSIFPKNQTINYEVTSASGENKKTYTIEIVNVGDWSFEFENWTEHPEDHYETPVEASGISLWTSGNPGAALSGLPKQVSAYPTKSTTDGYRGTKAAELVTIKGTFLSEFVGIYLIAGSIFLGDFNSSMALANPLAATEFGEPYVGLPDRFIGYYKYAPGAVFQDKAANPVAGRTDKCAIYAVLYKGPELLNGTNILTSDRVLATAILPDGTGKSDFTRFEIPFTYKPGWEANAQNLMMAIVASSSSEGDHYAGAIGSRLVIDSLTIIPK
ncbi:PCMD domain-containing protein [Chitinophaga horti]|uniref:PCMD domain-containing protein n=1 Tax=Chitinophaga horti TaxID=2920382 RepID=A0ABY6JBC1_9BACT|nr:PCMD domain-containing protein [Chitinophaga horti]UYQ95687.1 PCMD domain-containing protein [Chitinophaga horti]